VCDGDPARLQKRHSHPYPGLRFGPCLLWRNGWMDQDATWYGGKPRPMRPCVRRGPSSPRKGHSSPAPFSAHVYCGYGRPYQLLLSSCIDKLLSEYFQTTVSISSVGMAHPDFFQGGQLLTLSPRAGVPLGDKISHCTRLYLSHWPCVTDFSGLSTYKLKAYYLEPVGG